MDHSFVVYIDESGDEGFVFNADGGGSSRWFVLSAAVIRKKNDLQMVSCLKLPIRTVNVLVYKPLIAEPEIFQTIKYRLYRYATRMLLERVSWLCRDQRQVGEGDGFAEVIFSNRSNMSYDDIRKYLRLLLEQSENNPQQVQIDRTVIDPDRIASMEHSKLAGLQVADAVASGLHFAVRLNRYGETETAYLPHLTKSLYRRQKIVLGYGIKLWPEDFATLKAKAPETVSLEGLL